MKKRIVCAILLVVAIASSLVFALGGDYKGAISGFPHWPEGLEALVNHENRVHGFFVNSEDIFFYAGDTKTFNEFLASYSKLDNTVLQLVLHIGPKQARSPWDKKDRGMFADWRLYACPHNTREEAGKLSDDSKFITRIELFLGMNIGLDGLVVPNNIEVRSSGKLEQFVSAHKASQASVQKQK